MTGLFWKFSLWSLSDIKQFFSPFVTILFKTLFLCQTCFPAALIFIVMLLLAFLYVAVIESFSIFSFCSQSSQWQVVFFFLVQVRLSDVKKTPQHCNSLTLELVGWRLSIKQHKTLSSKKVVFLYLKTYLLIYCSIIEHTI